MKKLLLAGVALAFAAPALAADLPMRGPAPAPYFAPVAVASWTGFYVGLNAGGVSIDAFTRDNISGYTFGGRVGYDHQFSNGLVFGVLGDAEFSSADQTITTLGIPRFPARSAKIENNSILTANLRLGFAASSTVLLYATGGYSYFDLKVSDPHFVFAGARLPGSADGWNVGFGAEYRWTPNVSVYAEYRYHDLELKNSSLGDIQANQVKVGVNYRFASFAR